MGRKHSEKKPAWQKKAWRNGIVRSGSGIDLVGTMLLAIMFNGAAIGIFIKDPRLYQLKGTGVIIIVPYMFAAVGFFSFFWALISLARWLRFRRCHLKLDTMPGVIGGHFRGELFLPGSLSRTSNVRMQLLCEEIQTIAHKGQDKPSVSMSRIYDQCILITIDNSHWQGSYNVLPFDFVIPFSMRDETDANRSGNRSVKYSWRLHAQADLAGADLGLQFHVPVFRTSESDPKITKVPKSNMKLADILEQDGDRRRVTIRESHGELTFTSTVSRGHWVAISILTLVGLFLFGLAFGIPAQLISSLLPLELGDGGLADILFLLFPIVFLLGALLMGAVLAMFGLLVLYIAANMLASRVTVVRDGTVRQTTRLFGFPQKKACSAEDIEYVGARSTSSSGSKKYYQVDVELKCEKELRFPFVLIWNPYCITIATEIPSEKEAEGIATCFKRAVQSG